MEAELRDLTRDIDRAGQESIIVSALDQLRRKNGQVDTARSLRYVDIAALDALSEKIDKRIASLSQGSVTFLLDPASLDDYRNQIIELEQSAEAIDKVSDAVPIQEAMDQLGTASIC